MIDIFSPKTFVMSKEEAVLVVKEFRKYQRLALQPILEFCKKNKVVNRVDLSNDALLRQIVNQKHVGALASVLIAKFPQMANKWDEMDNLLHAVKLPFHCRYNCENSEGLSVWFHYPLPEAVLKRHGTESMRENDRDNYSLDSTSGQEGFFSNLFKSPYGEGISEQELKKILADSRTLRQTIVKSLTPIAKKFGPVKLHTENDIEEQIGMSGPPDHGRFRMTLATCKRDDEKMVDELNKATKKIKLPEKSEIYINRHHEVVYIDFYYYVGGKQGTESLKERARSVLTSLYHQKQPAMELFGLFEKWWEAKEISYWHICHGAKARPNIRETSVLYKNADTLAKTLAAMSRPVEGASAPFPFMVREGDPRVRLKEHKFLKDVFTIQHYLLHPKSDFQMTSRFEDDLAVGVRWKGMPDEPDVFMHVSLEDLLVQANLKFVAPDGSQYSKRKQLLSKYIPVINKQLKAFRLDNFGIDLSKFPYDTEIFCCGDMDKLLIIPAGAYDRDGNIFRDVENFMEAVNRKSGLTGMTLWRTGDGLIQTDSFKVKWTDADGSVYLKID